LKEPPKFILRLKYEQAANQVCIEIQDNGPGMDEMTSKRAFEPFFTTKPVGEGTGLGLSVSYFIIATNHGGTLDVVSSPGRGANFIICLPTERKDL
jgi:signal transduction histidine kinase